MIDRAIGIVGVALAVLIPILQNYFPQFPIWISVAGFVLGIMLIGLSLGLVIAGGLRSKRTIAKTASLRLHVYGDSRTPERISADNIFRWYFLHTAIGEIGPAGPTHIGVLSTLFVSFDCDVVISTLRVSSPDIQLPNHEVKEFNQRYAIIVFSGAFPRGTLEINVSL